MRDKTRHQINIIRNLNLLIINKEKHSEIHMRNIEEIIWKMQLLLTLRYLKNFLVLVIMTSDKNRENINYLTVSDPKEEK